MSGRQSLSSRVFFDAICEGDLKSVKFCLRNGAKINAKDKIGRSPLHIAFYGSAEIVKFLIQNGAEINAKNIDGFSPLFIAASRGSVEIVKFLLQHGADVNAKDKNGWSALLKLNT